MKVAFILYVDWAPITARGTFGGVRALFNTAAFPRTSVFIGVFDRITSLEAHFMPCLADRMALFVESDILRGIFGGCCPAVEINQRIHIPAFQHFISRNVVMGGIEADKFWGKTQEIAPEIVSCEEEIFAVMAFGIGKLHEEREIDLKDIISGSEHVQSMPEIPCFLSLSHPQLASNSE